MSLIGKKSGMAEDLIAAGLAELRVRGAGEVEAEEVFEDFFVDFGAF